VQGAIPQLEQGEIGLAVLGFALALSLLTGLLFGMVPVLRLLGPDLRGRLEQGGRSHSGARATGRTRSLLVLSEVAVACILLVGAALLIRSFDRLQHVDPGFRGQGVMTARVILPRVRYDESGRQAQFATTLAERTGALPGVTSAAVASAAPLGEGSSYWAFSIAGAEPLPPDAVQDAAIFRTSPGFFKTLRIPLLRGRSYDAGDREGSAPVAVINRTMAERYWPGRDPIGARITFDDPADTALTWMTVVGIVGDVHEESLSRPVYPQVYLPLAQVPGRSLMVAVRSAGDPSALVPALRRAVRTIDPDLPLFQVATMEERVSASLARPRINAVLLGGFALTALLLAAIGIYGVIAYGVVQRTRELGIRVALGARATDVLRMVIRQGMRPVLLGVTLGLAGALAGTRVLRSLLFGVGPFDPTAFGLVTLFLLLVALAATWLPARRAGRSDPMTALRVE
jgi:putative ABC transport system permease protein